MITHAEIEMFQELFNGYLKIIAKADGDYLQFAEDCNKNTLVNLVSEAIANTEKYPAHKLHRWLGFVQGILISIGELSVSEERDRTRPIFHRVYGEGKSFDATSV